MENQNYNIVKYSYTIFFKKKHGKSTPGIGNVKATGPESSTLPKYYSFTRASDCVVGIKFDNISDGKQITRIFNTHRHMIVKKETMSIRSFFPAGSHVTKRKQMVEAGECNEPTVLCQSTFH